MLFISLNWLSFLNIAIDDGNIIHSGIQPDSRTEKTLLRTNIPISSEAMTVHPDSSLLVLFKV